MSSKIDKMFDKAMAEAAALPPGFDGFSAEDVFGAEALAPSTRSDEPWRRGSFAGVVRGDVIKVGKLTLEVFRSISPYEVWARKPGAKRKELCVHQTGPEIEVQQLKGSPETTYASPVEHRAAWDDVRKIGSWTP